MTGWLEYRSRTSGPTERRLLAPHAVPDRRQFPGHGDLGRLQIASSRDPRTPSPDRGPFPRSGQYPMGGGEARHAPDGTPRTGYAAAETPRSGLMLTGRQPEMGVNVIRPSEPDRIIDRRLERQRGPRSNAGACHAASAKRVILRQAPHGPVQIGKSRLHRRPSG